MCTSNVGILILIFFFNSKEAPDDLVWTEETSPSNIYQLHEKDWKEKLALVDSFTFYNKKTPIKVAIRLSPVTSKQFIKGCATSAGTKYITPKQREGKPETTWSEVLRSLGKCGDLYGMSASVEGRRTNESQQTTGISHVDDWLKSNLRPKYSPTLFSHEFNQKLIFASFISASASY